MIAVARFIPQIFHECCNADSYRYSLEKAWVRDGFLWATTGAILVRCPVDDLDPMTLLSYETGTRSLPDLTPYLPIFDEDRESYPLPLEVPRRQCGRGPQGFEWPLCPRHLEECSCAGEGWEWAVEEIEVGPDIFNPHYVDILVRAGVASLEIATPESPARFRTLDFEGILMPLVRDKK